MDHSSRRRGETAACALTTDKIKHSHSIYEHDFITSNAPTTSFTALPPELRAMTATFNTAELLEHILSYIPPLHLLRIKATSRTFRNAIEASPYLRKEMNAFIWLGKVDESRLYRSDAGGDIVYPIRDLEPLVFFYPSDAQRRLFVRIATEPGRFEQLQKSSAFAKLVVVDQALADVSVGWHCGCFADARSECKVKGEVGMVSFSSVLDAVRERHESEGHGACSSMVKFWIDGLWAHSKEISDFGC